MKTLGDEMAEGIDVQIAGGQTEEKGSVSGENGLCCGVDPKPPGDSRFSVDGSHE